MTLWVGITNKDHYALGVEEASSIDQAYYQFMQKSIYPERVIQLPDMVVSRTEMEIAVDNAYFSACDGR